MFGHLLQPPAWKQSGTIRVEREGMNKIRKKIKWITKGKGKSKKGKRWRSDWTRGEKGGKSMPRSHTGQTYINKPEYTITQNKHKKLKPRLVSLYEVWPWNDQAHSYSHGAQSPHTVLSILKVETAFTNNKQLQTSVTMT